MGGQSCESPKTAAEQGASPESTARENLKAVSLAAWNKVREEPAQAAASAYFWLLAVGFAYLFGTGLAFDVNVIDFASASDFLVAGLRNPLVPLLAAVTGALLYAAWGHALGSFRALLRLAANAVLLLVAAAGLSYGYRSLVVFGAGKGLPGAPKMLRIRVSDDAADDLCGRIGVATSDFIVFGCDTPDAKIALVVARGQIRSMQPDTECQCRQLSKR